MAGRRQTSLRSRERRKDSEVKEVVLRYPQGSRHSKLAGAKGSGERTDRGGILGPVVFDLERV